MDPVCEVCEEKWEGSSEDLPNICVQCAKMFYPCCNSEDYDLCVECV